MWCKASWTAVLAVAVLGISALGGCDTGDPTAPDPYDEPGMREGTEYRTPSQPNQPPPRPYD